MMSSALPGRAASADRLGCRLRAPVAVHGGATLWARCCGGGTLRSRTGGTTTWRRHELLASDHSARAACHRSTAGSRSRRLGWSSRRGRRCAASTTLAVISSRSIDSFASSACGDAVEQVAVLADQHAGLEQRLVDQELLLLVAALQRRLRGSVLGREPSRCASSLLPMPYCSIIERLISATRRRSSDAPWS